MIRTPPSINWRDIVVKLVRACDTQPKAAKACGVSVSTIAQIASGQAKHPLFDTGLKLLAAYSQHVEPLPGVMELAGRLEAKRCA